MFVFELNNWPKHSVPKQATELNNASAPGGRHCFTQWLARSIDRQCSNTKPITFTRVSRGRPEHSSSPVSSLVEFFLGDENKSKTILISKYGNTLVFHRARPNLWQFLGDSGRSHKNR